MCTCGQFEYHQRWAEVYEDLLGREAGSSDQPRAIATLGDRARALEDFLASTAMCADAGHFEYPHQWERIFPDQESTRLLAENDTALEHYLTTLACNGVNEATGATCQFEYPAHWPQIAPLLFSGDAQQVREAVLLLERRDVALEDWIRNRTCAADVCATNLGSIGALLHGAISGSTLLRTPDADQDEVDGNAWTGLTSTYGLITFCDGTNIEDMTVDDVPGHSSGFGPCRIFMIAAQVATDEEIQRYDPFDDSLTTIATISGARNIVYHPDNGLLYVESSDAGGTLYTVDPDTGATVNLGNYALDIFRSTICAVPGGLWGWDSLQTFVFFELDGTTTSWTATGTTQLCLPVPQPNGDALFMARDSVFDPWLGWRITQALATSRVECLDELGDKWVVAYQSPDASAVGVEVAGDQWELHP